MTLPAADGVPVPGSAGDSNKSIGNKSTVGELLALADQLAAVSDSPELDLQLLLARILGCSRARLLAFTEQTLDQKQQEQFNTDLLRRLRGEPVAYILGSKAFWDFDLKVDRRVLVPRPETELLVEKALHCLSDRENQNLQLLDLGTGSGAIAIALARQSPCWQVTATDQSEAGLTLAAENARQLQVENIEFLTGSWFERLGTRSFDLIVSNPPYVAAGDPHLQEDGLPFEPADALIAADHGLACLMEIVEQARRHLKPGSWLLLEHGFDQAAAVRGKMSDCGYRDIASWQDLAGLDRVTAARFVS